MDNLKESNTKPEYVNHPSHYNTNIPCIIHKCKCGSTSPILLECIDVIRDMPSWKGNAIKYLWRAGLKDIRGINTVDAEIEDLNKAIWYIKDRIEFLSEASKMIR